MSERFSNALTLLELLVTLAILAALLTLALPGTVDLVARLRIDAERDSFVTFLHTARHAAIDLNRVVIVCPGASDSCGPRNSWAQGALVFWDKDRDRRVDPEDIEIARHPPFENAIVFRAFRNRSYLRFMPTGLTDWQNGHFQFCPPNGDARMARRVTMNYAGRMYFSKDRDGDGIHEGANGRALTC